MKKIFLSLAVGLLVIVIGCNKNESAVTPSNNQQVLGLVLQAAAQSNSSSLILLKDGRTISPVSGFNPTNLSAGNKFNLSFTEAQNTSTNGIVNVNVTNYSVANDSTFIPPPPAHSDSTSLRNFLQGTFTGKFTLSNIDYSNLSDTSKVVQNVSATFHQNIYEVTLLEHNEAGGSGAFHVATAFPQLINFVDPHTYPSGYDKNLLNGQYTFVVIGDKTLSLFKTTNNNKTFSGYLLTKN